MAAPERLLLLGFLVICSVNLEAVTPPSRIEVFFDYLKKTASETLQFNKETTDAWYDRLKNLQIEQNLQDSFDHVREMFKNSEDGESQHRQKLNRQFLEQLGRVKISDEGQTLNDYARDALDRLSPNFRNSDFFNDPAKTLSYFLMLDPKGFVENVRLIKGPLDTQMTLKEAYQYYTRTDPQKAEKILNMLESLQKLANPDTGQDQLQILLKSVEQTVELLNHDAE